MQLTVKYFGVVADIVQRQEEIIETQVATVGDFIGELRQKYPPLATAMFQVAQNLKIEDPSSALQPGELALLPPFAGG